MSDDDLYGHTPEFARLVESFGAAAVPVAQDSGRSIVFAEKRGAPVALAVADLGHGMFPVLTLAHAASGRRYLAIPMTEAVAREMAKALTTIADMVAARREKGGRA